MGHELNKKQKDEEMASKPVVKTNDNPVDLCQVLNLGPRNTFFIF